MFEWQQTFQGFTLAVSLEWKHWSCSSLPHPSKFTTFDHRKETVDGFYFTWQRWSIPAPSNGWCLNPKGLFNGTLSHPFGTHWRVQVEFFLMFFHMIQDFQPRGPHAGEGKQPGVHWRTCSTWRCHQKKLRGFVRFVPWVFIARCYILYILLHNIAYRYTFIFIQIRWFSKSKWRGANF